MWCQRVASTYKTVPVNSWLSILLIESEKICLKRKLCKQKQRNNSKPQSCCCHRYSAISFCKWDFLKVCLFLCLLVQVQTSIPLQCCKWTRLHVTARPYWYLSRKIAIHVQGSVLNMPAKIPFQSLHCYDAKRYIHVCNTVGSQRKAVQRFPMSKLCSDRQIWYKQERANGVELVFSLVGQ